MLQQEEKMHKLCDSRNDLAFPITLIQTGKNQFSVIYGEQEKHKLSYSDAAHEYGSCILHALTCDGKIDNG